MTRAVRARVLIPFLLCLVVGALNVALIPRERDAADMREAGATFGTGALHFRLMQLTDRFGRVPIDAYTRAKRHVDAMKVRTRARRAQADAARQAAAPMVSSGGATAPAASAAATAQAAATGDVRPGAWRWLGPGNVGGRIRSLVINPSNPDIMLAGSVGGGIWKTMNGGAQWFAVDDFMAVLSVSSMVMDPTNSNTIYAGTGEGYNNGDAIRGAGIFKSTDGGDTWTGLAATTSDPAFWAVNRLAISPDGKVLLAGSASGIYRSTNSGASFTRSPSGISSQDLVFHPTDSRRAVAAGWGSIASSSDGGLTWQTAAGFPSTLSGRIEVAYARSAPSVIYASVDDSGGALYRSSDGGATFDFVVDAQLLGDQGWYDNAIWVNPKNSNDVIVGGPFLHHTLDGGLNWQSLSGPHVDNHAIVEQPGFDDVKNRTVFVATDGGIYRTSDIRPASGAAPVFQSLNNNLGVTQFYSGAGNTTTGVIIGGSQDTGTLVYQPTSGASWSQGLGSDGGSTAADPGDPSLFYGETIYLSLYRSTNGGAGFAPISSGISDAGRDANFIAPFVLDPNNPNRMLAGGASLWRTENVKASAPAWSQIAGAGPDFISAIAIAPGNSDIVWVARSFGKVYRTTNGTAAAPTFQSRNVPTNANFVTHIAIDPFDTNVVYVTTGSFGSANIVKTLDGGATWATATGSGDGALPAAPVHDLAIDPVHVDTIYAATEVGLFVSIDGGGTWDLPQDGPANVCVDQLFWMGTTLVAATHGRGMFAVETSDAGAPAIALTPTHVDFGAQTIGTTSAAHTMTIANSGTAALHVRTVSLTGSQAGAFSVAGPCAGATLAPGASCAEQLVFHPTAAGTQSVGVSVASDAAPTPESVPASGIGTAGQSGSSLPSPWLSTDIGSVGPAGSASFSGSAYTLTGGGSDIWGSADAFQFAYRTLSGDGSIVARVASVQNIAAWTKAGVMIRSALDPSAAHASIFVTPGKGVALQYRAAAGGLSSNVGAAGSAPRWIKLSRAGSVVTASTSPDGSTWSTVGHATISGLPATVFVGLVISSHDATRLATAAFDNVSVTPSSAPASGLPDGWLTADVGAVGVTGAATQSGGTFTVTGAGADIWDSADAFRYVYEQLPGDGSIVARVAAVQDVHAWTKAGLMIRQSLDPASPQASMFVSAGKGLAFQRRLINGGLSYHTGVAGAAPEWVKLVRAGRLVSAFGSKDGVTWTAIGHASIDISGAVWAGLAVTSHETGARATATFDHVGQ
jgi:hypothetical protein